MSSVLCLVIGSKNDFYCLMLACLQPLPRGGHGGWNTRGAGVEVADSKGTPLGIGGQATFL
jgi:hypothetical protein